MGHNLGPREKNIRTNESKHFAGSQSFALLYQEPQSQTRVPPVGQMSGDETGWAATQWYGMFGKMLDIPDFNG